VFTFLLLTYNRSKTWVNVCTICQHQRYQSSATDDGNIDMLSVEMIGKVDLRFSVTGMTLWKVLQTQARSIWTFVIYLQLLRISWSPIYRLFICNIDCRKCSANTLFIWYTVDKYMLKWTPVGKYFSLLYFTNIGKNAMGHFVVMSDEWLLGKF